MAEEQTPTPAQVTTPPVPVESTPAATPVEENKAEVPASDVKPEQAKEQTPPQEKEKEEPVVPEKYDLKLSENSILDDVFVKRTEAYAKEHKLSQEDAQSILKAQEEDVAAFMEDRKAEWKEKSLKDPEIGGEKLTENIALASRMLKKFGSPTLEKELNRTGYGNHPEMVRLFVKIGKMGGEDKFIQPGAQAGAGEKTLAERLYGHMDQKKS